MLTSLGSRMCSDNMREQRAIGHKFIPAVIALKRFVDRLNVPSYSSAHLVLISCLCVAALRSPRVHKLLGECLEFVAFAIGGASEKCAQ